MASFQLSCFCVALVLLVVQNSFGCFRSSVSAAARTEVTDTAANTYLCGYCGQPITVNLRVINQLKSPFFDFQIEIKNKPRRELIYFLQAAANQDPIFRYSADYFGSLGYMVTKINGLSGTAEDKTFWKLIEHPSGNDLKLGVSSHVPEAGETIVFNFTTWN